MSSGNEEGGGIGPPSLLLPHRSLGQILTGRKRKKKPSGSWGQITLKNGNRRRTRYAHIFSSISGNIDSGQTHTQFFKKSEQICGNNFDHFFIT